MSFQDIEVAQIAAVSENHCIGKNNDLPWHIKADLQHFKKMTADSEKTGQDIQGIVIMGRKTFESMASKPLPKRMNVIVTTQTDFAEANNLSDCQNIIVAQSLNDALTKATDLAKKLDLPTVWVIGGERLFTEALAVTDRIELTHVATTIDNGDAFYPTLPNDFSESQKSATMLDDNSGLRFQSVTYQRRSK
ncbi:dihydrofolate reductase [Psychrobacter ciconiae]|uniref:dihydrofolate reductase n=1 Tax=Psychrobacter ciconiae TaxID=1553449 RepID=UPI001918696C|nr:dihydrofolate reductase [Psychrobacter ciconiae]